MMFLNTKQQWPKARRIKLSKNPEELLKPKQVWYEFGIKVRALAYMRDQTIDLGRQIGPFWINPRDTNIYYYKRVWIEQWLERDTIGIVPQLQNDKTNKSNKSKSNILNYPKHPK
jgi:hypothetical protein